MIEVINGENYFIDLDEIEKYVDMSTHESTESTGSTETRINIVKFEMIKLLVEVVLADEIPMEDSMGLKNTTKKMSVPFRLAFNSLLNKKIIKYF
jgi:hypothetical protein